MKLLDALRQRRDAGEDLHLYYLSNMPVPYARALEKRALFLPWFEGGIFSGDVQLLKPQREIYALLSERFGLEGRNTIFIDDSLPNVEAARAFGWHAIHCTAPSALPQQARGADGKSQGVAAASSPSPVRTTLSTSKPRLRAYSSCSCSVASSSIGARDSTQR